jgi:hypothetical protein
VLLKVIKNASIDVLSAPLKLPQVQSLYLLQLGSSVEEEIRNSQPEAQAPSLVNDKRN